MGILENISLRSYNTFGIDVLAKQFVSVNTIKELQDVLNYNTNIFILSGGSNMLLTKDIEKLVVHINIKGIVIDKQDENTVQVTANAGENWHDFVLWAVDNNYGGIENLSLIPGAVGTCPIQNIGAYGVEVKQTITKVKAVEIDTGNIVEFTNNQCKFGYRDSIFKNNAKGKYIIVAVSFKLTKKNHNLNTSYGAIEEELKLNDIKHPTLKNISDAVIKIRNSKLPNPKEIGNSGSFFKNPVIDINQYKKLKQKFSDIPSYPVSDLEVKVPAGWLIEKAGFKGKKFGNYGIHERQALVLVNYGGASGKAIYNLAKKIQTTIASKFGISLEIEVNIIT